jgi:hypothetical protein
MQKNLKTNAAACKLETCNGNRRPFQKRGNICKAVRAEKIFSINTNMKHMIYLTIGIVLLNLSAVHAREKINRLPNDAVYMAFKPVIERYLSGEVRDNLTLQDVKQRMTVSKVRFNYAKPRYAITVSEQTLGQITFVADFIGSEIDEYTIEVLTPVQEIDCPYLYDDMMRGKAAANESAAKEKVGSNNPTKKTSSTAGIPSAVLGVPFGASMEQVEAIMKKNNYKKNRLLDRVDVLNYFVDNFAGFPCISIGFLFSKNRCCGALIFLRDDVAHEVSDVFSAKYGQVEDRHWSDENNEIIVRSLGSGQSTVIVYGSNVYK